MRTQMVVMILAMVGSLLGSVSVSAQSVTCVAGPSLLLVQSPAARYPQNGFEDGLGVVDSCGATKGTIDVPNPAVVWPTARPGVAIVHSDSRGGETEGETYLVDAAHLRATRLAVPGFAARDAWAGFGNLNLVRSPRHALVGTTDPRARVSLVDLRSGEVTDVLAEWPADMILDTELDYGWIDPVEDAVYLRWGDDVAAAPIDDLTAAERIALVDPYADVMPGRDGCRQTLGQVDGAGLFACDTAAASTRWRVRPDGDSPPADIDGLMGFEPQPIRSTWSTSWSAYPFSLPTFSQEGLYQPGNALRWLLFADPDPDDGDLYVTLIDDLASLSVVDVPAGTVRAVGGLPAGRGALQLFGAVGGAPMALAVWMPWSEEHNGLFEDDDVVFTERVIVTGQLYLVDFESATATRLGDSSAGALSPDGGWVATTRVTSESLADMLSVGPVGEEPVEVGSGFGTWLTP